MPKPARAKARKTKNLPVLRPLATVHRDTLPLCNGAQTGKQCEKYLPKLLPMFRKETTHGAAVRLKEHAKRFRICLLPDFKSNVTSLHDNGQDMALVCGQYVASKRPYDKVFEESEVHDFSTPGAKPDAAPLTSEQLVNNIMASVSAGEKEALATGRPMIGEAGQPPRETRFQGPPADGKVTVGETDYLAQFWHHDDRGWLCVLPKISVSGHGPTRDAAEASAIGAAHAYVIDGQSAAGAVNGEQVSGGES